MSKNIILTILGLIYCSSQTFAMNEEDMKTDAKENIPSNLEPDYSQMHPAFAHYIRTGSWGEHAVRNIVLTEGLSEKRNFNKPTLFNTRNSTFYISETSNRIPQTKEYPDPDPEAIENLFNSRGSIRIYSFPQDHLGDLLPKKKNTLKRGQAFHIHFDSNVENDQSAD